MSHSVLTQYNSPNFTPNAQVPSIFGYPRSIDTITIHWWGDPNTQPTFEGVVAWLCNPRAQVSAHDVVTGTNRRVAVLVDYPNAAWHSGNPRGNATSLAFECDPRCRQEDYEVVAEDIAETWSYYGRIIPLVPHKSWVPTACPGNYDLSRLHQMALAIYNGVPATPNATEAEVRQAYLEILERPADAGGIQTYLQHPLAFVRDDLMKSQERKDLEARKAAEYARTEWVRNLQPYTSGDTDYNEPVKLAVLPAEGVKVTNLENSTNLNDTIIPRNTQVDVVAKTKVGGVEYYISSYSKNKGMANGILAEKLGVPAQPPVEEKPEWLQNLQDIQDATMYTRSETPVLNLVNGQTTHKLPINSPVKITHATQIVGINLLVLEGEKEGIETVYLSDTPIKDPDEDVKERLNVLEQLVQYIYDFLGKIFSGFKK